MRHEHRFELEFDSGLGHGSSFWRMRCVDPCPPERQTRKNPPHSEFDEVYCWCHDDMDPESYLSGKVVVRVRDEGDEHLVIAGAGRVTNQRIRVVEKAEGAK